MIIPEYEKLFEPYTKDGAKLENTIAWLQKQTQAPDEVIEQVVADTFTKLAEGYKFSTAGCDCGCGLKNAHTAIEHYMRAEVLKLNNKAEQAFLAVLEQRERARILNHIRLENEKFIAENTKPSAWKRIKDKIKDKLWTGSR